MIDKHVLRIPGPTPIPPAVSYAMSRPMIGHRSDEMKELLQTISPSLKKIFGTKEDVFILSSSGTGALETAAVNICAPGDEVVVVVTGAFGQRFADICDAYGFSTNRLEIPWGEACKPEQLAVFLQKHSNAQAVFMTYCETSTGVLNPIQALANIVKKHTDALVAVDGVSCIGGVAANMDDWQVDMYATGSQKAFMLPPGLAFIAASEKTKQRIHEKPTANFYFDLNKYEAKLKADATPFTPPVTLLYGLQAVLQMLEREGLENVFARHRLMRDMTRAAFKQLGIPLLAKDENASPTVTAVKPDTLNADHLRSKLKADLNVSVAGGPQHLKGEIFRIGHMGYCTPLDVLQCIAAIELAFSSAGGEIALGTGVKAAQETWLSSNS